MLIARQQGNLQKQSENLIMRFSQTTIYKAAIVATLAVTASFAQATRVSHVESNTVNNGGVYTYNFTVFNDSHEPFISPNCGVATARALAPDSEAAAVTPAVQFSDPSDCLNHRIFEWSMPYFSDSNITNIFAPNRWFSSIETIGTANAATFFDGESPTWIDPADPFYFGAGSPFNGVTQILRWYTFDICGDGCIGLIDPGQSLGGFGFESTYGATAAPYDAGWVEERRRSGDPDFPIVGTPASPLTLGADNQVPVPSAWFLLALGFAPLVRTLRKQA
jgi:hypothetical protein